MRRLYVDLPPVQSAPLVSHDRATPIRRVRSRAGRLSAAVAAASAGAVASLLGVPAGSVRRHATVLGARALLRTRAASGGPAVLQEAWRLLTDPLDSVRHAEFAFFVRSLAEPTRALDVSSPRLMIAWLLTRTRLEVVDVVNPNREDLEITLALLDVLGLRSRVRAEPWTTDRLEESGRNYDLVTCMSVLEHIPDDISALRDIWNVLSPGGCLLLSVPCSAEAFEEYINVNEYGLVTRESDHFFGQRFYSASLLEERVFSITGRPLQQIVYGERREGAFVRRREQRLRGEADVRWEPLVAWRDYGYFSSIDALPGVGVAAMKFVKS